MIDDFLEPIQSDSLKDVFVVRFEELILSGKIQIGQKLPSERDLAHKLGVSRPVVHEGLVELAARGLVTLKPRSGSVVNDYRKEGSITLLSSLIQYRKKALDPAILDSLLQMRLLLETEFSRFAAKNRTADQLARFEELLAKEASADRSNVRRLTDLDFEFHLLIALASGNAVYPLLLNSFRKVYTNLSGRFFRNPDVVDAVHGFHRRMVEAIAAKDEAKTVTVMKALLRHGEDHLRGAIGSKK